jgi:hypothetical protein
MPDPKPVVDAEPMGTPEPKRELPVRTVEQLSTLKALRVLDRFTMGRLAATAGVRAQTVRCMLLRWEEDGFSLLEQVDVEHSPGAGQPPKVYVLAAGMKAVVEASINAADRHSLGADLASGPSDEAIEPIERMNLLDVAIEMIAGAEQTADFERREKLAAEARRLLDRSRQILQRREVAGGAVASATLQRDLYNTEQRLLGLRERLMFSIAERGAELRRLAAVHGSTQAAADGYALLTEFAKHYFQTEPSGRDAEVSFFGGFLLARSEMGSVQDTLLDRWLFRVPERKLRDDNAAGLSWKVLTEKFAIAFGRIVEYGLREEKWSQLLRSCLVGIANNARLAVSPEIHEHVGRLMREARSGALRLAGQMFLQQYSLDKSKIAQGADVAEVAVDPYYAVKTDVEVDPADDRGLVESFRESFGRKAA